MSAWALLWDATANVHIVTETILYLLSMFLSTASGKAAPEVQYVWCLQVTDHWAPRHGCDHAREEDMQMTLACHEMVLLYDRVGNCNVDTGPKGTTADVSVSGLLVDHETSHGVKVLRIAGLSIADMEAASQEGPFCF